MEPPPTLSTIFQYLSDLIKNFLAFDAVSDFIHMISDVIKKFLAFEAVSDFIHMISDLIKKFLASDAVVYVVKWFGKENPIVVVAVAVIGILMIYCCFKCIGLCFKCIRCCCNCIYICFWKCLMLLKIVKTMVAPGQNFRIPRSRFEADPAGYFRNLRSK